MAEDNETIRWPSNLDRKAIEERLALVKDAALRADLSEISLRFADVPAMSAAQIASNVVAALTWLFDRPEHERVRYDAITKQLEMVALNLRNLK